MTPKKKHLKITSHNYSERSIGYNFDNGIVAFGNPLEDKGRNTKAKRCKEAKKAVKKAFEDVIDYCVGVALAKTLAQDPRVLDALQKGSPSIQQSV